jgi:hypothetical protein
LRRIRQKGRAYHWNGQQKAFEFIGMIGAILIVVALSDARMV